MAFFTYFSEAPEEVSIIAEPPTMDIRPGTELETVAGDNVTLTCTLSPHSPRGWVEWTLRKKPKNVDDRGKTSGNGTIATITVTNLKRGRYSFHCDGHVKGSKPLWHRREKVRLFVRESKSIQTITTTSLWSAF